MPGAMARPSKKKGSPADDPEDAFLRGVERFIAWTTEHRTSVIAGSVALVLLVAAGIYYVNYRSNLEEMASSEIQSIRAELATGTSAEATSRLDEFVTRFGGTEAGDEARILLGRLQMSNGDTEAALEAVAPVLERPVEEPLGHAAATITAAAHEDQGQREQALEVLQEVADGARFPFQRREANAARARLLIEDGRLEEAAAIYERLAEETESSTEQMYALRLGEVQAMISSGVEPSPAPTDATDALGSTNGPTGADAASDTAAGGTEEQGG